MTITKKALCPGLPRSAFTNSITAAIKFGVMGIVLAIGACATAVPAPNLALQSAESAIANADQKRVSDYDLPELKEARTKLTAARSAVHKEDMVLAKSLAEESRVSAELASAKAEQIKAAQINDDMKKGILTLNQEMQRNSGEKL
jgi:hypothetical protein